MTSTLDANVLLYASDDSSPLQKKAREFLRARAEGTEIFYLFWPTAFAYLRISTHPRVFKSPLEPGKARANIDGLLALPHVRAPGELDGFWQTWKDATADLSVRGNLVPDSQIAALMRQHGVDLIWTRDRDFRKFEGIRTKDPFA